MLFFFFFVSHIVNPHQQVVRLFVCCSLVPGYTRPTYSPTGWIILIHDSEWLLFCSQRYFSFSPSILLMHVTTWLIHVSILSAVLIKKHFGVLYPC